MGVGVRRGGGPLGCGGRRLGGAGLGYGVGVEAGRLISPLPVWVCEWERPEGYSNPELLRTIDREGVRLWNTDI